MKVYKCDLCEAEIDNFIEGKDGFILPVMEKTGICKMHFELCDECKEKIATCLFELKVEKIIEVIQEEKRGKNE